MEAQWGSNFQLTTPGDSTAMSQATCELGWSQLIHAEIISVTSAMRKNSRWSGMSVSGLNMGGLGMSMGLRGRSSVTEIGYRNQESPLMSGFATLKSQLSNISKETGIDAVVLLEPFLEVIRSGNTNGPITASALGSVEKFLTYGILNINSPNLPIAMSMLSSAATHCKFEASDSVSDEFVLLKILQVLRLALTCEVGRVLSDEALCEMMETGLSMCCQMRLSEMLRRSAEHTMIVMVQTMFERLKSLEEEPATWLPQDEGEGDNGSFQESQVRMAPPDPKLPRLPLSSEYDDLSLNNTNTTTIPSSKNEIVNELSLDDANDDLTKPDENWEEVRNEVNPDQGQDAEATELNDEAQDDDEKDLEPKPSGLPSIRELLRVLISLLNPHDHQHTDTMRLMALSILNVAFEVGGRTIGRFEPLRALAVDELCKHLFQLARTDNMLLLSLTLRVISTVFGTLRPYLKLQQELYLSFLIERLTPPVSSMRTLAFDAEFSNISVNDSPLQSGTSTPSTNRERNLRASGETATATGEVRELLLESLGQFAREPSFMVDLWVNYDCNIDCGDLFEEVVKFLSKNSFPEPTGYSVSNSHVVCLDALLMYVNFMVDRLQTEKGGNRNSNSGLAWDKMSATEYNAGLRPNTYPSASDLLRLKQQKQILREGAARFNENPKTGIEFLEANGIIYNDPTIDRNTSLALFLKSTPRLNKKLLGDFLSKPSNFDILKAFVKLFDFEGKRVDEAMREMLESFRLPGEAQQIERIMETFAETYFASGPQEIATQDATFVLSYSVIMLNTDLHNPQVRRRMSIEDYMKNLRNVNNGQNFSPEYLHAIYDAIRKREIIMPEEHEGQLGFNYAWKELLRRAESAGPLIVCNVSLYDKDMFTTAWKPTVAAISYAFSTAPNDATLQKTITGFHQCALLSAQYKLYDVFDYIIMSLSKMTGLLGAHYSNETANNPSVKVGNTEITVGDLSIQFGRNYKGQLAAVVLFAVANEHGNILREGWKYILEIIKNLFVNSLLPASMSQVEDFLAGTTTIPLKPKTAPQSKQERPRDNSLLSALSSYLLSPYSGNYESSRSDPTDEEIECSMCTVDCVSVCRLEELFADIRLLEQTSLEYLMRALKFIADGNTATKIGDTKTGYSSSSPSTPTSQVFLRGSSYDPSAVFFLELMINVTLQNRDRIQHLWPILFEHITDILKESQNNSILLVERTVVALLRLCIRLTHKDEMVSDILQTLELLGALPLDVVNSVGEQMMAGILNLIKSDAAYIRGKRPWKTVFTLLHATSTHPQASKYSFDAISSLVRENKNINSDNFNECVELLAEFASAASSALEQDSPHESHMRTPRSRISKTQSAIIDRARKAVELLYILYNQIPKLLAESETPPREAWSTYWLPILTGLSQQCYNPCREVRQCAISFLQRSLLDPELVSHGVTEWVVIFDVVLFPLLDQLLKPEIFQADPTNMEETRIRASALICKIFLHYLSRLLEWGGLTSLWSQILDVMERYMATGNNESLREAVPESLKNMLLVMSTSGVFNPPGTINAATQSSGGKVPVELWDITWTKIDKFLPKLKDELFPEVPSDAESSLKSSQNLLDTQLVIDVSETNEVDSKVLS
ncbi:Sec7-domain-containing protein [Gigaspora margarita]|uniref:Sec7-domain-containing protein n=1 Tax=Gigaspora margarita TaxID=4874 RepID=A0A8H4A1K4_GIGMA|nr:Sec7-domain-containing protein [Gigaspora margarita]